MVNDKYELTEETILVEGVKLHRIRALRDMPDICVKKGDIGGFIQTERNLSVKGKSWVSGNAQVSGDAQVYDNAWVSGNARVYDNAGV